MPEYSFVTIPLRRRRGGTEPATDYQQVIREQAAGGWTFVQAISFELASSPHIDLVFTRKAVQ